MFTVAKTYPITGVSLPGDRDNNGIITDTNRCMTYRTDTAEPLGVVSNDYNILQPEEAEELVNLVTDKPVETLWSGKKMIYTAEISQFDLGNDPVNSHLVLVNSFDGKSSITAMGTTFRIFCANQLSLAFNTAKRNQSFSKVNHNGDFVSKIHNLRMCLKEIRVQEKDWQTTIQPLVNSQVTESWMNYLWKKAAPIVLNLSPDLNKENQNIAKIGGYLEFCKDVFEAEVDKGCRPSKWLAANAVTNYIQHNLSKKGRKPDMDKRYVDCAVGLRADKTSSIMRLALVN